MPMQVKDVMNRVVIAVSKDASFIDILAAMMRFAVGAVTVIDADQRPVGVVSEDDLLLKEIGPAPRGPSMLRNRRRRERDKAAAVTAAQLMTSPAITVTPGSSLRDAARLMHTGRVKQLPVIDVVTGRVTGTLHQRDVLRVFTRPAAQLEADIRAALPQDGTFTVQIDAGTVRISGRTRWRSQAIAATAALREVEGVVDVTGDIACDEDDLVIVPSLM
ncbi:CBS domain-containing protein [Nonomuraea harbinensis]|uniref:CBS domain-containing protein n=1 Tax=Nonomuraea harbinensis TaxID=1286938 RepID=A0ABW1CBX7_9ACTN|nr:CBS domain-containing protein [Nonomuraea harbinensis]